MYYVAKLYKFSTPLIVEVLTDEKRAITLAKILTEEKGQEHIVLKEVATITK